MAAGAKKMTEQMLERISPPRTGRMEISDALCPGLCLRITPAGAKTFSVAYKVPGEGGVNAHGRLLVGIQHRITLGSWPILGLREAREEARKLLVQVSHGIDPRIARKQANVTRFTNTFESLTSRFIEQEVKPNIKSWRNVESALRLHVVPHWSDRPVTDLRRRDVHLVLDALVANGRFGAAREVRKHLSKFFNWAVDREIVLASPVHSLRRSDLRAPIEVGRALTDDEIRAIWNATSGMPFPFQQLYMLLLLTGQRRNEWAEARRSELDLQEGVLEVSRHRYKGRRDHIVPLNGHVIKILGSLPAWSDEDYFLFSTRHGAVPVSGFSKAKKRLNELTAQELARIGKPLNNFRVHDMRVTCETRLAQMGFSQEVRDAVLGHAKPGLQKTYNKHDYLSEKREALNAYATHILQAAQ